MRIVRARALPPALGLLLSVSSVLALAGCDPELKWHATVAQVEVLRPSVGATIEGGQHPVVSDERLIAGSAVRVGERAQAVLRHDGGARLLLDEGTELTVTDDGARLATGRVWVDQKPGSTVIVSLGNVVLSASGAGGAGFEIVSGADRSSMTVIRGEVAWRTFGTPLLKDSLAGPGRGVVRAGEMALLGDGAKVAPVALWDDWTGGLGWPDSRKNGGAPGLGEVGARRPGDLGEARFPLSIQRLQVRARIEDDLAITTVEQTFFNPAESTLEGIYRVRIPEGAILSRFAIDRRGRYVDGYVKERETARREYQEKVFEGSTHDPALLEWEAPGSYKARLYPLPPGAARRVLVTYTEWLPSHEKDGTLRTYRYPMAAAGGKGAPVIQELDIEVDARLAGATEVRPGLGAVVQKGEQRVVLQRTDYLPTADLSVELIGARRDAEVARGYRAVHLVPEHPGAHSSRAEDDYVLLRAIPVPAPAAGTRAPLDLVLVVDLSAATDATHLAMARTFAEAALRRLTPEDRVTLLGADLDLHDLNDLNGLNGPNGPNGPGEASGKAKKGKAKVPPLQPATPEQVQRLLAALGRASTGGATDLGTTLSEAAALLEQDRLGAVVYVGDAQPTVGEIDLPGLRERLDRLPAPLRFYGVGIGAEADLGLLTGLTQVTAGQAFRVSDRPGAAEAALLLVSHLSRPAATRITVDAGAGVDRVYPRQPVSLLAGEPLSVMARVRKGVPATLTISGQALGKPFHRTFKVEARKIEDTADLRLRWSQARLQQLLQSGASTEEVAELGVRQNLITPFTSFYVPSEEEIGQFLRQMPQVRAAGCARSEAPMSAASTSGPAPVSAPAQMAEASRREKVAQKEMPEEQTKNLGRVLDGVANGPRDDAPAAPGAAAAETVAVPRPQPALMRAKKASAGPSKSLKDSADPLSGLDLEADKSGYRGGDHLKADDRGGGGAGEGTIGLGSFGRGGRPAVGSEGDFKAKGGGGPGESTISLGLLGHGAHPSRAHHRKDAAQVAPIVSIDVPRDESERGSSITLLIGLLTHRPRGCSAASEQPLDERIDLWRERLSQNPGVRRAQEVFQDAQRGCELPRWTDRREILRLMLRSCQQGAGARGMVQLYQHFGDNPEEQDFLRRAILGEVKTPADLRVVYDGLGLGDEEQTTLVQEVVHGAKNLPDRLRRITELLVRWPGNLWLKLQRMEAEELSGEKEAARRTADEVRQDPYADAQARTAVGELLLRQGDEEGARRAFSEIVEFAPKDPLARRRLGDLYRAHGWFDEAYRQYQTLLLLSPADLSVLILQAAAAAGAGHVEESLGLLQRITGTAEPGSETGLSRVALLWTDVRLLLLRDEARKKGDAEELAKLLLRGKRTGAQSLARPVRVILTWAHPEADLELFVGAPGEALGSATELAPQFGLLGWQSDAQAGVAGAYQIEVRRGGGVSAALRHDAELLVVTHEGEKDERIFRLPLSITADEPVLRFSLHDNQVEVRR